MKENALEHIRNLRDVSLVHQRDQERHFQYFWLSASHFNDCHPYITPYSAHKSINACKCVREARCDTEGSVQSRVSRRPQHPDPVIF